ncbi:hypothetical protein KDX31_09420 [Amphritea atlantica]|uniref:DUF3313 domain-containing protein n=1 Tax=Amphritea atlantica TaxID=355243 RepID=A0ABY5GZV6_9GAMM|nr:hypothetical protein KDX31_09420 [Amphritea atlantica]
MKYLWVVLLVSIVTGCSANKPYVIDETSSYGSDGSASTITIVDDRPSNDKEFSYGSFMVFNSDYGIWTLGDEQFSPNLVDLIKLDVHKKLSKLSIQPESVEITFERMIVQANHQADMLQSSSTSGGIGPLGVLIAEAMHGKEFELDYDKTRPFVIGLIKAKVKSTYPSGKDVVKNITVSKAENLLNHMDSAGREKAAISVATNLTDSFTNALIAKN